MSKCVLKWDTRDTKHPLKSIKLTSKIIKTIVFRSFQFIKMTNFQCVQQEKIASKLSDYILKSDYFKSIFPWRERLSRNFNVDWIFH